MPIVIKLDVTKIDKTRIFQGKKGKYIDLILIEKPNNYGDDGFISHSMTKEEREAGKKSEILGNWKNLGTMKQKRQEQPAQTSAPDDDSLEIPF